MIKPISPNQVKSRIKPVTSSKVKHRIRHDGEFTEIPNKVIEVFNKLIVKHYRDGCAAIKLDEAVKEVCKKMKCDSDIPCDKHWMDVEKLYQEADWNVEFDNPGYNETYPATYYFTRKRP